MSTEQTNLAAWFSTYGLLTVEQILDRFHIHLKHPELVSATSDPENLYYQLLRIPFKNVFNGIILEQVIDYRVYAQKLFVDYLVSGAGNQIENSPGMTTRADLEQERLELVEKGEAFERQEEAHYRLIAESQSELIKWVRGRPKDGIQSSHFQELLRLNEPYHEKTEAMHITLCDYRSQFYNLILRSNELLQLLPDYRPNLSKQLENRERLNFNAKIGENP